MPTITIKVSAEEKRAVEAAAGRNVSRYIRSLVPELGGVPADASERLEAVERRLSRVEEIAGL